MNKAIALLMISFLFFLTSFLGIYALVFGSLFALIFALSAIVRGIISIYKKEESLTSNRWAIAGGLFIIAVAVYVFMNTIVHIRIINPHHR